MKIELPGHNPKTIGEHIRKVRMDKGLLQADVAAIIGVKRFSKLIGGDAATISSWENGENKPLARHKASLQKLFPLI